MSYTLDFPLGFKVKKTSNKPFKSGEKVATVKGVHLHPHRNGLAYSFEEDDSLVSTEKCVLKYEKRLRRTSNRGEYVFCVVDGGKGSDILLEGFVEKWHSYRAHLNVCGETHVVQVGLPGELPRLVGPDGDTIVSESY